MTAALLAVVALATVTPGQWSGATPDRARAHARVTFDVGSSPDLIQPFLRIDLPHCRTVRTLHLRTILRPLSVRDGRFATRARFSPAARAMKVRLRFRGVFASDTRARVALRGRLRYAGGHVCRIPPMALTARPVGLGRDDGSAVGDDDEDLGDVVVDDDDEGIDDEDIDDGDYEEDDEGEGDDGS